MYFVGCVSSLYPMSYAVPQAFVTILEKAGVDYTTMGILPVHILGNASIEAMADSKFNAFPIGTGPFAVAEVSARRILLVANPNFYRSRPYLDRLEFVFYPNDGSVFQARALPPCGSTVQEEGPRPFSR